MSEATPSTIRSGNAADRFGAWVERVKRVTTGFSVRTKILGIVLALTTVLGLAVTLQVRSVLTDVLVTELDNRGRSVVSDLAARSVDPLLLDDAYSVFQILNDTVANHPDAIYAFVVAADGSVIAHTFGEEGFPTELLSVHAGEEGMAVTHQHLRGSIGRFHDFRSPILDGRVGVVRVGLSEDRLAAVVDGITAQMLVTTLFVGLLGVVAASLLTWLLTRPILDLVSTTRQVSEGDLSARASHWAEDEIGDLSLAFNRMVADLESNRATIAHNEAARTRLLEQLITAQEEERKRIARELHDTVGQALGTLMVGVSHITRASNSDPDVLARSEELQALARETLEQVRELSRELRPSALDDLGLAAALKRYGEDFGVRYAELSIDLHVDLPDRLPSHLETALYRVVQEGMTNAARHSGARTLSVLISRRNGVVQTIIEDDGTGFDPSQVNGEGVGIHGMRERAELLGGRLTIESGSGGTTLYVEVPT